MAMPAAVADEGAAGDTVSRWIACAAGVCSVHCLVSPFLALAAPFLVITGSGEWWLWGGTVSLSALLLFLAPRRIRFGVAGLVGSGAAIWAASLLGWFHPIPEFASSPVGSLLIAGGMLRNARLCRAGSHALGGGVVGRRPRS